MPKQQRLSRVEFLAIDPSQSRRFHGTYFTLSVFRKTSESIVNKPKFACVVSKKVALHAVDRNRIRRFCRETFRLWSEGRQDTSTYIFYAKKEAKKASFHDIEADVTRLVEHRS